MIKSDEEALMSVKEQSRDNYRGPALGVVKTLHTDNTQHKDNMKT